MRFVLLIGILMLAGCGGDGPPTATLPPPTSAPATETPVPLADLDLEPLLLQSGDLPSALTGGQIRSDLPPAFEQRKTPPPDAFRMQLIEQAGKVVGSISLLVYEDLGTLSEAYQSIVADYEAAAKTGKTDTLTQSDIGDESQLLAHSGVAPTLDLVFRTCHAVATVALRAMEPYDQSLITNYARRVEKRLKTVVCR